MARDVSPLATGFSKLGYTLGALPAIRQKLERDRLQDDASIASALALADERGASAELKQRQLERALQIVQNLESPDFKAPPGFRETANPYADSQSEAATAFQKFGDAETQRRLIEGDTEGMDTGNAMALLNAAARFSDTGGRVLDRYSGDLEEGGQQAGANVRATDALAGTRTRSAGGKGGAGGRPRTLTGPQLKFFEQQVGEDRFTGRPIYAIDTERLARFRRWMADRELTDEPSALNTWLLEQEPDAGTIGNELEQTIVPMLLPGMTPEVPAEQPVAPAASTAPAAAGGANLQRVQAAIAKARAAGREDLAQRIEAEARQAGLLP